MTVAKWTETLQNNLVSIDREVDLLSSLLLFSNFPSAPALIVYKASQYVQNAIVKYLKANTVNGCMNRNSINYDPSANFDQGNSCEEKYKFGGIISNTCNENNVLTGASSCPAGYSEKKLEFNFNPSISVTECVGNEVIKTGAVYFGGSFSTSSNNPVTNSKSCPNGFNAQKIFDCSSTYICTSTDYTKAISNSIPFGGFVSDCFAQSACPIGFDKIFLNVINACEISYCTKLKSFKAPQLMKPPFVAKPPSYKLLLEKRPKKF